ncbi:MAG: PilX N-terminal domain-containing pilus assembly protein [Steroidobacteraceae bacterium]
MALISSLLLLLIVTIMAVSMFRSYGTQEKIAGNVREKQRAVNAAVSAQQYAEWLLSSGTAPPPGACTGIVPSTAPQVCNNTISYTTVPWTIGVTYTSFTTNNGNGVMNTVSSTPTSTGSGATLQTSYYQTPTFYITDLGPKVGGTPGEVFQIDALGYGGSPSAVAVVESTYLVTLNIPKNPDK